jgi:UDP-galactopyranose mutase
MTYDYVIVGAGLFGATFAQRMIEAGRRCLVVERRPHIAGNAYTEEQDGIQVHVYGPHLFHTSNERIWRYVNRFAAFNGYHHQVQATTRDLGVVSLPINLHTLQMLFGITTPEQARSYLDRVRVREATADNVEEWCLRTIGWKLYDLLIKGYTIKQWGRHPRELPASIIKRLPIRLNWNNRYFSDRYEGIPVDGYTKMVERMLAGSVTVLGVDYLQDGDLFRKHARKVVYSGPIDELFRCDQGALAYRSIRIEHERIDVSDHQGIGQMNYTGLDVPWTRIVEPKHFTPGLRLPHTIISREESVADGVPYYPIGDAQNTALAAQYQQRAAAEGYLVGGRLGRYQYLDMHQAIGMGLAMADQELGT